VSRLDALLSRAARLGRLLGRPAGLAVVAGAVLVALAGHPYLSRPEAAALERGRRAAAFWATLPASPGRTLSGLDPAFAGGSGGRPGPALAEAVSAGLEALVRSGPADLRAGRLATAAAGALLTLLLAVLGHAVAGRAGGLLAPALFWLAPRTLAAGLAAGPDVAAAALWLLVAWAYRRALVGGDRAARMRAAALSGACFGLALAVRADSVLLLAALALHAAGAAAFAWHPHTPVPPTRSTGPDLEARLHGVPAPIAAMLVLGPTVAFAASPWLWPAPVARVLAALAPAPPAAWPSGPLAVLAFATPGAVLWIWAGGFALAGARALRAPVRRDRDPGASSDDALLAALALAGLAGGALGLAPRGPGLGPVLPALPFLSLVGARGLVAAAHATVPTWPRRAVAALAVVALAPGAIAAARARPLTSAWSELAGGAPGAASRGLPRQDGGEGARAALADVAARARPGARIRFVGVAPEAVRAWAARGLLRPDLAVADGDDEADVAVVAVDGGSRDAEYQTRAALRADRPVAGVYVDEVPLALVYARAGAWR